MADSFQAKIADRRYHVYKNLAWSNAKQGDFVTVEIETDKESKKIDPYCCAIKAMVDIPLRLKTVGHVPKEISRHIFFFSKEENGKVDGFVYSTQYQPSPIPAGRLEIPLKITFKSPNFITHQKMKDFMTRQKQDGDKKKRTVKWLSLRSRGNPQRFVNHQDQIVRTVKWLNQQLRGSPQKG